MLKLNLIKRISGYTFISIIVGGTSFLLLPILTHYLLPEDYGVLSIFNASTRFFVALIPLGMGNLLLVYLIDRKNEYPAYLSSFVRITFAISVLFSLIISIAHLFISDFFGLPTTLAILLPLIALFVVYYETITGYFIYLKKFNQYAKFTLIKFFVEILLVIALVIVIPLNWEGRVSSLIISLVLIVSWGFYFFKKYKILDFKSGNLDYSKELIKKGFPLIFMGIAIMVMELSDRFFIEYFVGLEETGYYGIASAISSVFFMVIVASMNVLRPIIYSEIKQGESQNKINLLTFRYILGLLLFAIFLYLASPFFFDYLISQNFIPAKRLSIPLIWSVFFWGVYSYFTSFFLYFNYTRIIGSLSVVGILTNLILNYYLVLHYGTIGAAYSTLITYFVMSSGLYILYIIFFKIKDPKIV